MLTVLTSGHAVRGSVVGLNFDFLALNLVGFTFYSVFNCGLYFSAAIQVGGRSQQRQRNARRPHARRSGSIGIWSIGEVLQEQVFVCTGAEFPPFAFECWRFDC